MKLAGKVALITGGGGGIGAAVAERFVKEGAKILISGRRQELLENMAKKLPKGSVEIFAGDVSRETDVKGMVETALKFGGKLDVLVNNAGISMIGSVTDISIENWDKTLFINLTGPMMMMKEAIPHMIKAGGGSIINIASVGGLRCLPGRTAFGVRVPIRIPVHIPIRVRVTTRVIIAVRPRTNGSPRRCAIGARRQQRYDCE